MYLSHARVEMLSRLMGRLEAAELPASAPLRLAVGSDLLALLQADHFASYAWDDGAQRFGDRASIHMDDANLQAYEAYYQYHDPITHQLRQRREPTLVTQILPQQELMKTEFFNDFLARDGLHHGVNLFAWDGGRNLGDLRIWRSRQRGPFDRDTLDLLRLVQPAFTGALRRLGARPADTAPVAPVPASPDPWQGLNGRAREIAQALCAGWPDKKIAAELAIGYSTVRTHVDALFERFGVHNRTELVRRLLGEGRPH
ncbi:helix-turn-helix transcriptional regulator [Acidovorax sp. Root217]|uniref:helix-turn-helix transcriptional regulator n=1 Tax=Acidovorax sp. Root217 TaxID=1736492 RepID=UPI00070A340E|nr:helix-turn-helix transcriptional regulator [Acidovorax sp. Root217]KRC12918.1 hypothetical protein ASE31_10075 [Acidovorax sp. Root217]